MKLFFDARFIRTDYPDGISRYSSELLKALHKIQPVTAIICDKKQLEVIPDGIDFVIINKPSSLRELFVARTLNHYQPDVVFSPMQLMGGWGRNYLLILTVHDLIYYQYKTPPSSLPALQRLGWWLYHQSYWPERWQLSHADVVVAVSKATKQLIRERRLTRRPIRVVYNAPATLDYHLKSEQKPPSSNKIKHLVWMGSFMPYKNTETLMQALFFLPQYRLHCLSPIKEKRKQELLALAPPNQVVFHNGVSDGQYARLLASAHALVSASKNEGFGLPIIEAMRLGVPVVCSDIPIFHEVAGSGALYFSADNQTEFAKQVMRLEDGKIRARVASEGLTQAKKFNWELSAKELLRAIKDFSE